MKKLAKILDLSHTKDKRFIVIGDIHGSYGPLMNLLEKCKYNKNQDIIVSCGDLADRGNASVEVLRFFMPDNPHEFHHIYSVLGNHDYKLQRYLMGNKIKISNGIQNTIDELAIKSHDLEKGAICLWLSALPHIIRVPDLNGKPCYIVHAGVDTKFPIEKQSFETCIYIRGVDSKNYFDESKGIWFDSLKGDYYILSGHIVSKDINPVPWNFALDTGCCHGGKLTAMVIENGKYEIVQVDGLKRDMKIPNEFRIINGNNGERLISPKFGVGNDSWKDKESLWLRSLHINKDDKVISVGLPKFFNLGEAPPNFKISEKDLFNKRGLVASLKVDGSLLIRFVQDGVVKWRTRGSLEVGLDNKDEINGFVQKYPKLNDPTYYNNVSLLFEWVSPRNQIVIKYEAPEIYLVGGVLFERNTEWHNNDFTLLSFKHLEKISEETGICCVQHFSLNDGSELTQLIEKLKTDKEIEGYVIRFNDEQELVKIKAEHYKILHYLKSKLDSGAIVDLFLCWEKPSFEEFKNKFIASYDYEIWTTILPAISSICDAYEIANSTYHHIKNLVIENRELSRKDFALMMKQKYSGEKLAACFSLLDDKPVGTNFFKTIILQNIKDYNFSMFKKDATEEMEE